MCDSCIALAAYRLLNVVVMAADTAVFTPLQTLQHREPREMLFDDNMWRFCWFEQALHFAVQRWACDQRWHRQTANSRARAAVRESI